MEIKTGGPAFPVRNFPVMDDDGFERMTPHYGLTIRDYFAAKAMQGLLACPDVQASAKAFAITAYNQADAMIEARGKE